MSGTKMRLIRQGALSQDWVDQEIIVTEEYLAAHTDMNILLDVPIEMGISQLEVYFNGQRMSEGGGYEEVDSQSIRLDLGADIPLQIGDEIFIRNWISRYYYHQNNSMGPPTADKVGYINSDYPQLTNVKKALDKLLYVPIAITSFSNNINQVEKGTVLNQVNFSWGFNKQVVSQSINQGIGVLTPDLRNYTLAMTISSDIQFTLTASDGEQSAISQTGIFFRNRRWWGVSSLAALTSSADIISLGNSELSTGYVQNRNFNANGGKYIYFSFPATFTGTPKFTVGGFTAPFDELPTVEHTNSQGYTTTYRVFRSTNLQNDTAIPVVVS